MKKNLTAIIILVSALVFLFVVYVPSEQQGHVEDGGLCTDSSECKFSADCTVYDTDASIPRFVWDQLDHGSVAIQGTCGGQSFGCMYVVEKGFISKEGVVWCVDPAL